MTYSPKPAVRFALLAGVAALGAFLLIPRPEPRPIDTAPIEEAIHEQGTGTRQKIDELAVLLTDTSLMPAGSLGQASSIIERIDDVEREHGRVIDLLVENAGREKEYEQRMEARQIRVLCWASANCDIDCPQRRTRCGTR